MRDARTEDVVPVWLQLREDDSGPQDDGDINRYDLVGTQAIAYRPGPRWRVAARRLAPAGRFPTGNGRNRARLTYRLSTLNVVAPPPPVPGAARGHAPAPPAATPRRPRPGRDRTW